MKIKERFAKYVENHQKELLCACMYVSGNIYYEWINDSAK